MSMVQIRYRSKRTGGVILYEYAPPEYICAQEKCLKVLERGRVLNLYKRRQWRVGKSGRVFRMTTVQRLINSGKAVRDGDVVRRAA